MIETCPVCDTVLQEPVWVLERVPILPMLRLDELPQADHFATLEVVRCQMCGHLYNRAYHAALADRMYRGELLSNVPVHVTMTKNLEQIADWIGRSQYADKRVIEIGAGSGHLARILAQVATQVQIFEPCRGLRAEMLPEANITVIHEPFSSSAVDRPADLIVCRQVLEHVADPLAMLRDIRAALSATGSIYLEVPRAEYIEEHAALFDLHYAHVQYFHEPNLLRLAARAGFQVVQSWCLKQGHDMGVLLRPQHSVTAQGLGLVTHDAEGLRRGLEGRRALGHAWLNSLEGTVSLYGATAQGVAFLHVFQSHRRFTAVADDNPAYAGYALYTTGQSVPIVDPTHEAIRRSDHLIITAYLHDEIIAERLRAIGFSGRIFSIREEALAPAA
ncbi:MAG: methyltransferase domain-containing protein [Candidatus Omnitrophica bacterium]|nr:methyltransferase domain-containing protein [Candidatus Omnitrophota bacterium]